MVFNLILISNYQYHCDSTVIREDTLTISVPLDHEIFVFCFMSQDVSVVCWFIVCGNLNRIYILLLCENYINLNYVQSIHSAFQVYYLLLFYHSINF